MKVILLKLKLVVFSVQCYSLMWKPNLYLKCNISIKGNIWFPHYKDELPMHLNLSKRSRLQIRLSNFNQTRFAPFSTTLYFTILFKILEYLVEVEGHRIQKDWALGLGLLWACLSTSGVPLGFWCDPESGCLLNLMGHPTHPPHPSPGSEWEYRV